MERLSGLRSRALAGVVLCLGGGVPLGLAGCGPEEESIDTVTGAVTTPWQNLTLGNGWSSAVGMTAAVRLVNDVITFKGAIVGNANATDSPFTLPAQFRPATGVTGYDSVRLRLVMSGNTGGSLEFNAGTLIYETHLRQDGLTGPGSAARTITSLDGVSLDKTSDDATRLGFEANYWTGEYGFRNQNLEAAASAKLVDGFVRFQGFLKAGVGKDPLLMRLFTLPPNLRPGQSVFVPVNLCAGSSGSASYGRLRIHANGEVFVQAPVNNHAVANCGVSLEGASFSLSYTPTSLSLAPGWTPYSPRAVKVRNSNGVIRFEGAVKGDAVTATSIVATLPVGMRPSKTLYVVADVQDAKRARLIIHANGEITIDSSLLGAARGLLSLDGVFFALP